MSKQETYENTPVKAHYCEDGSLGVMDFCGYKKVGADEPKEIPTYPLDYDFNEGLINAKIIR